jgi:hypothetical protein
METAPANSFASPKHAGAQKRSANLHTSAGRTAALSAFYRINSEFKLLNVILMGTRQPSI